jgi:hypothetical protein
MCLIVGCSGQPPVKQAADTSAAEETKVRERFQELQTALKAGDTDKLWNMLDTKSQTEADQIAKTVRESYASASAAEKTKWEEQLGLAGDAAAKLTGQGYLKSKRFQRKFREVPEGKIEKVTFQNNDSATVNFDEPDGDHEKAIFLRQAGQWKVWLTMPKVAVSKE